MLYFSCMKNARNYAFHLLDYGFVTEHDLLMACLNHMTDNNIETMLRACGLLVDNDLEEVE